MLKFRMTKCFMMFVAGGFLLGCGDDDNKGGQTLNINHITASTDEDYETSMSSQIEQQDIFDYESLGVSEYFYPNSFELDSNLKSAIEVLAAEEEHFSEVTIADEEWRDDFLRFFIYSDYDGPEYEKNINKDSDGEMTCEQVEYIQYSLTGSYCSYEDLFETVDSKERRYSPRKSVIINQYEYEIDGDEVLLHAEGDMSSKGNSHTNKCSLECRLIPNRYSCFDGYSIVGLDIEANQQTQSDDGNKHEIIWYCTGEDVADNLINGEFYKSSDTLSYNMFVALEVSEDQKKFILENAPADFVIIYEFTGEDMPYPISKITPCSIEVYK